ncbi:hypothetical protein D3C73_1285200 [compost metagenome]
MAVLADDVLHFLFVFGADRLFQVTTDVLQDIGMGAARGAFLQGGHQFAEIAWTQFPGIAAAHVAQQMAEDFVVHRVVGHQQVFVARVKVCEAAAGQACLVQLLPGAVGEYAGQEVFPQHRIVESTFFFHR